jgi:prepilin-type N-terminal cleavage/methylation domain-containing protein
MGTRTSESGFTLVELMIASVITLVVMGVAFSTFKDALALNEAVVQLGESSQNLRAGTNLLVRDLLQAGRNIPTGGIFIPSGPGAQAIHRPGPKNTDFLFDNDNEDATTLTAITTGAGLGPTIAGTPTDIVTILMDDPYLQELKLYPSNAGTNRAKLAADGSSFDVGPHMHWIVGDKDKAIPPLMKGDLVYFSNARGTALQTVTNINGSIVMFEANDPFKFNQPNAGAGSITEILPDPCEDIPTCQAGTGIRRVLMYTYYVEEETPGIPRLMRKLNHFDAHALAGVIEDLALSYDLVDGKTNPTNIIDLPYSAQVEGTPVTYSANQIRKVNLHVGVRSELISVRTKDYLRNHLSTVVSLRNLAYVDRYDTSDEEEAQ